MQLKPGFVLVPLLVILTALAWWMIHTQQSMGMLKEIAHAHKHHLQRVALVEGVGKAVARHYTQQSSETQEALRTTPTLRANVTISDPIPITISCTVTPNHVTASSGSIVWQTELR
jgi:hypothetical protein